MQPYIDLCENLTKLVINNNLVKKFPPAFTELQKLKYLDVGGNQLKKYPSKSVRILGAIITIKIIDSHNHTV